MARSGWCIENTTHKTNLTTCTWDKCDCTCHNDNGTGINPTKRKPTKRKGSK